MVEEKYLTYQDPAQTQQVRSNQPEPSTSPDMVGPPTSYTWVVIISVLAIALVAGAIHYKGMFTGGPQPIVTMNSAAPDQKLTPDNPTTATVPSTSSPSAPSTPAVSTQVAPAATTNGQSGTTY